MASSLTVVLDAPIGIKLQFYVEICQIFMISSTHNIVVLIRRLKE